MKKNESAMLRRPQPKSVENSQKEFDNPAVLSKQLIQGDPKEVRTYNHSKFGGGGSSRSPASVNKTLYIQDITP